MINFHHIAQSIDYYEKNQFVRLEVPWWVTKEIADLTKPANVVDYFIPENNKVLVASAEQSFLYLANKGQLPRGKFQATTPCFRNEPIDLLHQKCFIKNELINTIKVSEKELDLMVKMALKFFSSYISKKRLRVVEVESHKSLINYDIVAIVNGQEVELGSYGIRQCEILKWIYGTGCAEPRLSLVMNRINLEKEHGKT